MAVLNLFRLYNLTFAEEYQQKARKVLSLIGDRMNQFPTGYAQMLIALDFYLDRSKEVAIVGPEDSPEKNALIKMLHTRFAPNKVLAYAPPKGNSRLGILQDKYSQKGQTLVYVCENNICKYPTGDPKKVKKLMEERKQYSLK